MTDKGWDKGAEKGVKSEGRTGCMTCVGSSVEKASLGQLSGDTAKADAVSLGVIQDSSLPMVSRRFSPHSFRGCCNFLIVKNYLCL